MTFLSPLCCEQQQQLYLGNPPTRMASGLPTPRFAGAERPADRSRAEQSQRLGLDGHVRRGGAGRGGQRPTASRRGRVSVTGLFI